MLQIMIGSSGRVMAAPSGSCTTMCGSRTRSIASLEQSTCGSIRSPTLACTATLRWPMCRQCSSSACGAATRTWASGHPWASFTSSWVQIGFTNPHQNIIFMGKRSVEDPALHWLIVRNSLNFTIKSHPRSQRSGMSNPDQRSAADPPRIIHMMIMLFLTITKRRRPTFTAHVFRYPTHCFLILWNTKTLCNVLDLLDLDTSNVWLVLSFSSKGYIDCRAAFSAPQGKIINWQNLACTIW